MNLTAGSPAVFYVKKAKEDLHRVKKKVPLP